MPANISLPRTILPSYSLAIAWLCATLSCWSQCTAQGQPDKVDAERAGRYVKELIELQQSREKLRSRAESLLAQNPNLQQEFMSALQTQLVTAGALEATPKFYATPQLVQTYQTYRGQQGELILQPQLMLWYALQDNTLIRQQLFLSLINAQRDANISYVTLQSTRVALEQVAQHSDENFLKFRRFSDLLGRRSALELAEVEAVTSAWLKDDPLHAGASLLQAYALRSTGRHADCTKLLETLDNNFPIMESIAGTIKAQIAWLGGSTDDAKRLLDKAMAQSQQSGSSEAATMYGWLMMAENRFDRAESYGAKARQLQPDNIESAILEGLATAYSKPARAREALQILRRGQLYRSPDDWHYHEALAIVHQMARDHQFAKKEIAAAIAVAPAFMRPELEREQTEIQGGNIPQIDWAARLKLQLAR